MNHSRLLVIIASFTVFLFICVMIVLGIAGLISLKVTLVFLGVILLVVLLVVGIYFLIKRMGLRNSEELDEKEYDVAKVQEQIVEFIQQRYADRFKVITVYPEQRFGDPPSRILRVYGYCVWTKRYCNVLMNMDTKKFGEVFSQDEREILGIMERLAEKRERYIRKVERLDPITQLPQREEDIPFIEEKPEQEGDEKNG